MTTKLLIIDPQNDFHDAPTHPGMPGASLAIPGSFQSAVSLAAFLDHCGHAIDEILVTRDEHDAYDIGHPRYWKQTGNGLPVRPFTQLTSRDLLEGLYITADPSATQHAIDYLMALEDGGYGPHMVWPEHCKKGTWGACVVPEITQALEEWSTKHHKVVPHIYKGMNPRAESYSALGPSVTVGISAFELENERQIRAWVADADILLVAGQASSHCVAQTVYDIWQSFPASKTILLQDCMNFVPGFEDNEKKLFREALEEGGRVMHNTNVAVLLGVLHVL